MNPDPTILPELNQRLGQHVYRWNMGGVDQIVSLDPMGADLASMWAEKIDTFPLHERVAQPLQVATIRDARWLVSIYVEGRTIAQTLQAGPIPVWTARVMAEQSLEGVVAIHSHGLLHGGITTSRLIAAEDPVTHQNTLTLTGCGAGATPIGTDGGLPALPEDLVTAPEIWAGRPVSCASDLYSLGCTLYEIFSGTSPFSSKELTREECAKAHIEGTFSTLSERTSGLPGPISHWVAWLMKSAPSDRPTSAGQALSVLREMAQGKTENLPGYNVGKVDKYVKSAPRNPHETSRKVPVHHTSGRDLLKTIAAVVIALVIFAVGFVKQMGESIQLPNIDGESGEDSSAMTTQVDSRGTAAVNSHWKHFLKTLDAARSKVSASSGVAYCAVMPQDPGRGFTDSEREIMLSLLRRQERFAGATVLDFCFLHHRCDILVSTSDESASMDDATFCSRLASIHSVDAVDEFRLRLATARQKNNEAAATALKAPWLARMTGPMAFTAGWQAQVNQRVRIPGQHKVPLIGRPKVYFLHADQNQSIAAMARAIDTQPAIYAHNANPDQWPWTGTGQGVRGENAWASRIARFATSANAATLPPIRRFGSYRMELYSEGLSRAKVENWNGTSARRAFSNAAKVHACQGRPAPWPAQLDAPTVTPGPVSGVAGPISTLPDSESSLLPVDSSGTE